MEGPASRVIKSKSILTERGATLERKLTKSELTKRWTGVKYRQKMQIEKSQIGRENLEREYK